MMYKIKNAIKRLLPESLRRRVSQLVNRRFCTVCNHGVNEFLPCGIPVRPEAECPGCGALERHRLIWPFFQRETNLLDGRPKRMLHIAPEASIRSLLSSRKEIDYLSADLEPGRAMVEMDITRIQYPDDSFDAIYASHVLEHVPDDRRAMSEFVRVLKPGGWAVLQVPIVGDTTDEDLTVTDPVERRRRFGQHDHVRTYGRDYRDRLAAAGFEVEVVPYIQSFSSELMEKFGLDVTENVYFCRKGRKNYATDSVNTDKGAAFERGTSH